MEKRVLAFGCFDIVHPGHIFYLKKAAALGSELVVVVARDSTIIKGKSHKPVQDEKTRLEVVRALKPVDKAILGSKAGSRFRVIERVKPDVIALGYNQRITKREIQLFLKDTGLKAKVVRMPAFKRKKYKSTLARNRIELGIEDLF